jgi:hypothetical protein
MSQTHKILKNTVVVVKMIAVKVVIAVAKAIVIVKMVVAAKAKVKVVVKRIVQWVLQLHLKRIRKKGKIKNKI